MANATSKREVIHLKKVEEETVACGKCHYYLAGVACVRYPQVVRKLPTDWCGEFKRKG